MYAHRNNIHATQLEYEELAHVILKSFNYTHQRINQRKNNPLYHVVSSLILRHDSNVY